MAKQLHEQGERKCPVCAVAMTVTKKGPIKIDVCEDHGVWLDKGELEAIVRRRR